MKSFSATIGGLVGGAIGILSLISGIGILFFTGSYLRFVAEHVLPIINLFGMIGLFASLLIALPMLLFRKTRGASEVIFALSALAVGFAVSIWSVLLIYEAWGKFWTLLVLIVLPFVSFFAALAQAFQGDWGTVGMLVLNVGAWMLLIWGSSSAASLNSRAA